MRLSLASAAAIACASLSTNGQHRGALRRLDGTTLSTARAQSLASRVLAENKVTGAQLAILNGGRTVWTYAYGQRDTERALPMTADTNIWAASITKGVFATWLMRLVEAGRLDLDTPVASMLSKPLTDYEPYRDTASALVQDARWTTVTPRMLLSHTSGLANFSIFEPDRKLHLHFTPGSRFAYSGDGLNLLQFAIEQKLQLRLDEAMQNDIFGPLAMQGTSMVWRPSFAANTALRYDARGTLIGPTRRNPARAAGSMATNIGDLCRFTEALLGGKILTPAGKAEMLRPQIVIHSAHQFPTLDPATGNDGEAVGLAYGLGWGLLTHTRFGPAFFKEGHGDGAETYMICFTRSGTCMLLLTNSDNGELAFRPLLEQLIGDTVTPWEWEGYTREQVLANEEHTRPLAGARH